MVNDKLHIIMPVKDSLEMAERAIRAIVDSGHTLCVYDDNSLKDNAKRLDELAIETNIRIIHLSDLTDHPSPNYRLVLQLAQKQALTENKHLVIVESDVMIQPETLNRMVEEVQPEVGMVAAVTVDENGEYNFPYHYLRRLRYRCLAKKQFRQRNASLFAAHCSPTNCCVKLIFSCLTPPKTGTTSPYHIGQ
jgi:hypothetical protein